MITETIKPLSKKQFNCLVRNIYHEARGESLRGKLEVAAVTINRTKHPDFPKTICEVVYQKGQFSWTEMELNTTYNRKAWVDCADAAVRAYYGNTGTALYFHHVSVRPRWAKTKTKLYKIDSHVFYQ